MQGSTASAFPLVISQLAEYLRSVVAQILSRTAARRGEMRSMSPTPCSMRRSRNSFAPYGGVQNLSVNESDLARVSPGVPAMRYPVDACQQPGWRGRQPHDQGSGLGAGHTISTTRACGSATAGSTWCRLSRRLRLGVRQSSSRAARALAGVSEQAADSKVWVDTHSFLDRVHQISQPASIIPQSRKSWTRENARRPLRKLRCLTRYAPSSQNIR
jgi:hypothetical protein